MRLITPDACSAYFSQSFILPSALELPGLCTEHIEAQMTNIVPGFPVLQNVHGTILRVRMRHKKFQTCVYMYIYISVCVCVRVSYSHIYIYKHVQYKYR